MENSEASIKKELISRIEKLNEGNFLANITSNDLGAGNIRNMGNVALNCDCYSEFKLYMEYKKAKIDAWKIKKGTKALADIVIEDMEWIYDTCHKKDEEALRWISQYFGYFYWKKSSIEEERKTMNGGKKYAR